MTSAFRLEYVSVDGRKERYDDGGRGVMQRFTAPVEARELVPA